jgi:hypothetical protein
VSTAAAATIRGTARADLLRGTARPDRIDARAGNDRVTAIGGGRDSVACGSGRDIVTVDESDGVARDCEVVSRRIANDVQTSTGAGQHRTHVESSAAANVSTVVSVFQSGRLSNGGAAAIGFATSSDDGRTWRSGLLPGLTRYSPSPGQAGRASDPVVAFDALHDVWLASTLILGGDVGFNALYVNSSPDGLDWNAPIAAARTNNPAFGYDKNWITCDNGETSPRRGTCYVAYTDVARGRIALVSTRDGGATWSTPVIVDPSSQGVAVGAIPLVQPDSTLTVVYDIGGTETLVGTVIAAARSTDGGATFAPPVEVAPLVYHDVRGLRSPALPAAAVDAAGRIYVVWTDCTFRTACSGNDLVLSTSIDGRSWSTRKRMPRTGFDSFVPGIAAHPTEPGRLAVVTYLRTESACNAATCTLGVASMRSADGGATWTQPQRLDAEPMPWLWLANSDRGAFLGDYVGIAYTATAIVPAFPLATRPSGGFLNEAMFATRMPG